MNRGAESGCPSSAGASENMFGDNLGRGGGGVTVLDGRFYVAAVERILFDSKRADPNGDVLHGVLSGGGP